MDTDTSQQKNSPELRFNAFSDTWNVTPLKQIYKKVTNGFVGTATPYYVKDVKLGVKYLQGKNVKHGRINDRELVYISHEFNNRYKKSQLKNGDLLMVQSGHVGECAVVPDEYEGANCHAVLILSPHANLVDSRFIKSLFYAETGQRIITKITTGNTVQHILASDIANVSVAVPNLPEQRQIADFLESVDAWLDNLRQQKTALETYKRGMMQKLFTQQVRFKDDGDKDFPKWQEKKLGQIEDSGDLKLGRGNVISKRDMVSNPGEYPIYSSSVKDNGLFGKYGSYMFDEELITWSVDGGGHFFYRPEHKFSITNVSGWMRVLNNSMVTKFLAYQLQYHHTKLVFDYSSKAHPSVIRGMYTISLPSKNEQQKIADFLTAIDETITAKAEEVTKVEQWKKGLMQKMFV